MTRALAWLSVSLVLLAAGCASPPLLAELRVAAPPPAIRLGVDTLAFRNESRAKNRGKPDLYANWCFVMTRAVTQFHRFARFDPSAPRVAAAEYTERVRQATSRAPWRAALPLDDRIVIPGYANLYEFSRDQESAVKAGLNGRFLSWIHWTNWRVAFPVPGWEQERVARETLAELEAGRPVQWLITNLPKIELNHTVLVYDYRLQAGQDVEFVGYDPNDPANPAIIRFEAEPRRFWSTRIYDTSAGPIRAFRMYYSPLL